MSGYGDVQIIVDRIPGIKEKYEAAAEEIIGRYGREIEQDIRRNAPKKMPVKKAARDAQGKFLAGGQGDAKRVTITIGNRKRYWAGFVEFGTVFQPARPFAVPAVENRRSDFVKEWRDLERRLS